MHYLTHVLRLHRRSEKKITGLGVFVSLRRALHIFPLLAATVNCEQTVLYALDHQYAVVYKQIGEHTELMAGCVVPYPPRGVSRHWIKCCYPYCKKCGYYTRTHRSSAETFRCRLALYPGSSPTILEPSGTDLSVPIWVYHVLVYSCVYCMRTAVEYLRNNSNDTGTSLLFI